MRPRQAFLQCVYQELVHCLRLAKSNFHFRRVNINVDQGRVELEEQNISGISVEMQHILVSLTYRVRQELVTHEASVDIEILRVSRRTSVCRQSRQSAQPNSVGACLYRHR